MSSVFLLWHSTSQDDPDENAKLLGVYSTRELADARVRTARALPGFRRYPDGFVIDSYEVDAHHWTDGFVTMGVDGEWVPDPEPLP